jgi:hypothetical protein
VNSRYKGPGERQFPPAPLFYHDPPSPVKPIFPHFPERQSGGGNRS